MTGRACCWWQQCGPRMRPPFPLQSFLSALRRDGQITELEVGPLNASETAAVAEAVAGHSLSPEEAGQLFQETEGNPLFVVESVRAGAGWGDGQWGATTYRQPPSRLTPVHCRPKFTPSSTPVWPSFPPRPGKWPVWPRPSGGSSHVAVLARASDQDDEALVASLDELWQRRIVRERSGDVYDFTHDKLREVAYSSLSAARRRLLHRRIAQALEAEYSHNLDAVTGQVAVHYELAGCWTRPYPIISGRARQPSASMPTPTPSSTFAAPWLCWRRTAQTGLSALALCERLGDILHLTGQYEEARAVYLRGLAQLSDEDGVIRARLLRKAATPGASSMPMPRLCRAIGKQKRVWASRLPQPPATE